MKTRQREHVHWTVNSHILNSFFKSLRHWDLTICLICPLSQNLSLPCCGSSSSYQFVGAKQGLLFREAEWSAFRSTELLHPGIKILSQEGRNLGQAKSLSAASLEELKGNKSTNEHQTNHKGHFGGNGWATRILGAELLLHVGKRAKGVCFMPYPMVPHWTGADPHPESVGVLLGPPGFGSPSRQMTMNTLYSDKMGVLGMVKLAWSPFSTQSPGSQACRW